MELKQSRAGRTYIRLITKNHFVFPVVLFVGVAAIMLMLIFVKIDVMQTYGASVEQDDPSLITLDGTASVYTYTQQPFDVYLYTDKNTTIYKASGDIAGDTFTLETMIRIDSSQNQALQAFLQSHKGGQVNADIAVRQISLLQRIFSR